MDKKTEALKLALEALESCEMSNYGRDWVWPATAHETAMKNVKEAITAIREALAEQPAQQQGPVAKVCHDLDGHIGWNPNLTELPAEGTELYTSPPASKPWVGLTEKEEIQPLLSQNRFAVFALARAIEAKLREKNAC